ncbi:hypothetical protein SCHPADRAFT_979721 [Schizopora paradoxa]|uniref:Transmembrane protein n=1 Tax=Schizopora paradoxa TaxID=27342 RepID=A0A0H2RXN7_9AGAM|nr:hypothetical protein SCHPADRAFT_979721 [Schizopora paradoxa]
MVDWQSPAEIARDGQVFSNLVHCLLGLYLWELFTSLKFDYDIFSRKRRFKWPMIFYFLGRYALFCALLGITISLNVTTEINCQLLYVFNQICGNISIGCASINLSFRTIAVWSQSLYITIGITIVILGHWGLLLHGLIVHASWVDGVGCVVTQTDNKGLTALFIYTMTFDFIVMCLTAWKLAVSSQSTQSRLVRLIFRDGLFYFFMAFAVNTVATTFIMLNLNPVMSVIGDVPAAVVSTIVASRAVRRLSEFTSAKAEVYSGRTAAQSSGFAFRSKKKPDGVHVQVNHISTQLPVEVF